MPGATVVVDAGGSVARVVSTGRVVSTVVDVAGAMSSSAKVVVADGVVDAPLDDLGSELQPAATISAASNPVHRTLIGRPLP
jgi:xanthine/CO dehydrogenase XdhC/CoxF family maturation factor